MTLPLIKSLDDASSAGNRRSSHDLEYWSPSDRNRRPDLHHHRRSQLINVVGLLVREFFSLKNLVLVGEELIQRWPARKTDGLLAGLGERQQRAFVVNA